MSRDLRPYAPDIRVHEWWCSYGTNLTIVAAATEGDARALLTGRYELPGRVRLPRQSVKVRRLREGDRERLDRINKVTA